MDKPQITMRTEQKHDCGQTVEQIIFMVIDSSLSISLKLIGNMDHIELNGHYNRVEYTGCKLQDDKPVCTKCGADVRFPSPA